MLNIFHRSGNTSFVLLAPEIALFARAQKAFARRRIAIASAHPEIDFGRCYWRNYAGRSYGVSIGYFKRGGFVSMELSAESSSPAE